MRASERQKLFNAFYKSARHNDVLDERTTIMLHLASAMALGCYPWMQEYFGVAKETGITQDETDAVQSIVMAVSGGQVRAQFREARLGEAEKSKTK